MCDDCINVRARKHTTRDQSSTDLVKERDPSGCRFGLPNFFDDRGELLDHARCEQTTVVAHELERRGATARNNGTSGTGRALFVIVLLTHHLGGSGTGALTCRSRVRCQAATGSWTRSRQSETQRTLFTSPRAILCPPAKANGVWPCNAWLHTAL
jgi:hypothetical protein